MAFYFILILLIVQIGALIGMFRSRPGTDRYYMFLYTALLMPIPIWAINLMVK